MEGAGGGRLGGGRGASWGARWRPDGHPSNQPPREPINNPPCMCMCRHTGPYIPRPVSSCTGTRCGGDGRRRRRRAAETAERHVGQRESGRVSNPNPNPRWSSCTSPAACGRSSRDKDALPQYGMCRRDEAEAQAAGDNSPSKLQRQPSGGGGGCSGSLLSWDFSVGESRGNLACCNTQRYHGWSYIIS